MEFVDIYNDFGEKTGKTLGKDEVHSKALIHKGVCVWIMNSNNEILLQTRSSHVMFPNMLDISFSGHIQAGETSVEAAIREGKEELGINLELENLQYLFSCREYAGMEGYFENEIDDVFLYRADIPIEDFNFSDNEVKDVSYVSIDELKRLVTTNSTKLLAYEMHYHMLLTALNSRLVQLG